MTSNCQSFWIVIKGIPRLSTVAIGLDNPDIEDILLAGTPVDIEDSLVDFPVENLAEFLKRRFLIGHFRRYYQYMSNWFSAAKIGKNSLSSTLPWTKL